MVIRKIEFYKDYFIDFYSEQNKKVQEKIELAEKLKKEYFNDKKKQDEKK